MRTVTESPWIADFRSWIWPEVAIPVANQEDCGLWERDWTHPDIHFQNFRWMVWIGFARIATNCFGSCCLQFFLVHIFEVTDECLQYAILAHKQCIRSSATGILAFWPAGVNFAAPDDWRLNMISFRRLHWISVRSVKVVTSLQNFDGFSFLGDEVQSVKNDSLNHLQVLPKRISNKLQV